MTPPRVPPAPADEIVRLQAIIERERTRSAIWIERIRCEIRRRRGISESRGPYEWDDDEYFKEFGAALDSIAKALDKAATETGVRDHSDCPPTTDGVERARTTPVAATPSEDSEPRSYEPLVADVSTNPNAAKPILAAIDKLPTPHACFVCGGNCHCAEFYDGDMCQCCNPASADSGPLNFGGDLNKIPYLEHPAASAVEGGGAPTMDAKAFATMLGNYGEGYLRSGEGWNISTGEISGMFDTLCINYRRALATIARQGEREKRSARTERRRWQRIMDDLGTNRMLDFDAALDALIEWRMNLWLALTAEREAARRDCEGCRHCELTRNVRIADQRTREHLANVAAARSAGGTPPNAPEVDRG